MSTAVLQHPLVDREVQLRVPSREVLTARVDAVGPGHTDLALLQPSTTPPAQIERGRTFLEFVNEDGVCRMMGQVRVMPDAYPQGDAYGVFEMLRFEHAGSVQLLQRREFIRTDHVTPVVLTPPGSNSVAMQCVTLNVSGGGMLVRGARGVRAGDLLHFRLSLEEGQPALEGTCRVVRATGEGDHGVQFTTIEPKDQDALVAFAFNREREERDRKRGV